MRLLENSCFSTLENVLLFSSSRTAVLQAGQARAAPDFLRAVHPRGREAKVPRRRDHGAQVHADGVDRAQGAHGCCARARGGPARPFAHWPCTKAVLNPTVRDMQHYISGGEQAAWPHVNRVRFMLRTETCLRGCVRKLQAELRAR